MKRRTRRGFGSIRRLPSGRYQASFVTPTGLRALAPMTFGAKVDAEGYLSRIRREIDLGTWAGSASPLDAKIQFGDFAIRHISLQNTHLGKPLKPSTRELYGKLLTGPLLTFLDKPLNAITKTSVDDWWIQVTATGKRSSSAKAYKLLSAVLKRACDDELIHSNPCAVRGAQTAVTGRVVYCPKPNQVAALARAISPAYSVMVLLMAYGGLRFGEVTELRVGDLSKNSSSKGDYYTISITRAVTYVGKKFIVGTPKSAASVREVPLTSALTVRISEFLSERASGKNTLLFPAPTRDDNHLRNDVFAKKFSQAKRIAEITDLGFTPHSLRHFGGTYFATAGGNLVELKEWLGDSSTVAAQRYLHSTGRGAAIAQAMPIEM